VCTLPIISVSVVPEIRLKVVDRGGNPVAGATVEKMWIHNSFESDYHYERVKTDPSGEVLFPSSQITISISRFFIGKLADKLVAINPHAAIGPFAAFRVEGHDSYAPYYRENEPPPQLLVVDD
ncbi:MAG TPA: hypothetical protein PKE66_05660, partial [Pyrinomonadaceae bacterium]|nr:hypothetical protein [Pyrinomonadaceae bacterium]